MLARQLCDHSHTDHPEQAGDHSLSVSAPTSLFSHASSDEELYVTAKTVVLVDGQAPSQPSSPFASRPRAQSAPCEHMDFWIQSYNTPCSCHSVTRPKSDDGLCHTQSFVREVGFNVAHRDTTGPHGEPADVVPVDTQPGVDPEDIELGIEGLRTYVPASLHERFKAILKKHIEDTARAMALESRDSPATEAADESVTVSAIPVPPPMPSPADLSRASKALNSTGKAPVTSQASPPTPPPMPSAQDLSKASRRASVSCRRRRYKGKTNTAQLDEMILRRIRASENASSIQGLLTPPNPANENAANWQEMHSANHEIYYYNRVSQVTTWARPACLDRPAGSARAPSPAPSESYSDWSHESDGEPTPQRRRVDIVDATAFDGLIAELMGTQGMDLDEARLAVAAAHPPARALLERRRRQSTLSASPTPQRRNALRGRGASLAEIRRRRRQTNRLDIELARFSLDDDILTEEVDIGPIMTTCSICFDEGSDHSCLFQCAHTFCDDCLGSYARVQIEDFGNVLHMKCPDPDCSNERVNRSVLMRVIDPELLERYDHWKALREDPLTVACPKCNHLNHRKTKWGGMRWKKNVVCGECSHKFCFRHGDAHVGETCRAYRAKNGESGNKDWKKKNAKRCPACKAYVEKQSGCNHMTCLCGADWCWLCEKHLKSKIYGHWSSSNLLGCPGGQMTGGRFPRAKIRAKKVGMVVGGIGAVALAPVALAGAIVISPIYGAAKLYSAVKRRRRRFR